MFNNKLIMGLDLMRRLNKVNSVVLTTSWTTDHRFLIWVIQGVAFLLVIVLSVLQTVLISQCFPTITFDSDRFSYSCHHFTKVVKSASNSSHVLVILPNGNK